MSAHLLHHLLDAAAERRPGAGAVVDRQRRLTYAELAGRANRVARLLVACGVAPGERVGLYLEKSPEAIAGLFGVLKAGAAYVPLDHHAPAERLAYIAADCGIRTLLTTSAQLPACGELVAAGAPLERLVVLDATGTEADGDQPGVEVPGVEVLGPVELAAQEASPPPVRVIDLDLAYILYTSGSTGRPKGVMLTHRNALTFVEWAVTRFAVSPEDRLSSHAPLHFDLSVFDVFAASAAGAGLFLVPPEASVLPLEAVRFMAAHELTVWYSVPSILVMIALRGGLAAGDLPRLRAVLFAGEVLAPKHLRRLMELLPHADFHNLYGPTETNVCTHHQVRQPPGDGDGIPIGRAIDRVEVFALTDDGQRAAPGQVGELYVRGTTVMSGYWGDHDRSAQVLVPDPLGRPVGDRAYRTGDLVREDAGGNLHFLGRRDAQIKSRGYRIELGEIEAALHAHPAVLECAVVAVADELVTNRITAYVARRDDVGRDELVAFCGRRIPKYMIPETFEFREKLPKTSTGKIDRLALARGEHGTDGT
ncbi:MAG TPA: amino acid adenylation domain-containing protein [Acidimicrobiales bacterium]|nr:amino acid adenylation domain-containing protein [Acidimicrobiales bacterium]HWH36045.1 amino acid adenylation domain-containing protein [Acidimicrobiales bacterium]